jgi:hypothetical protein
MISIFKKRREGQIHTFTITLSDLNDYYPRSGRIQLFTAFCPASTAIFGSRQGFATLSERTVAHCPNLLPGRTFPITATREDFYY